MSEQSKIDAERAKFNDYLNEVVETKHYGMQTIKLQRHDEYTVDDEKIAWEAWQARASLPVGVPEGYALVPARMELLPEDIAVIMFHCGGDDDATEVDERFQGGVLWVGETRDDDGSTTYGLNIACVECLEEGSTPVVEFSPPTMLAAPTVKAEQWTDGDNIKHLNDCDVSGCGRCENLMYFYQACDECGAWGHNDAGPCACLKISPSLPAAGSAGLTFNALRAANAERIVSSKYRKCEENWTPAHWMQATVGELGELANLLKKVDRGDFPFDDVKADVAKELADVQTYLDILALKLGVDLGQATIDKFNEVSERIGSPVRLAALSAQQPGPDVRGLVEALMSCAKAKSAAEVGLIVDEALADHRKAQRK